jgi:hypothetical protein
MNSPELVTIVAEAHDLSKAQVQAILDSVLKSIVKAAVSDDEVSLDVWSRALMVQSCRAFRRMRYGPSSSWVRHDDRGSPSSDTT